MSVSKDQQVAALYVAVFNRAPDQDGLNYWLEHDFGGDMAQAFITAHPAFDELYGELTNEEFVNAIYQNVLGQEGDAEGVAYWTEQLESGVSKGDFLAAFVAGAFAEIDPESEGAAEAQARQDFLANRTEVALYFATTLGENSNGDVDSDAYKLSQEILNGVGADAASVAAAKAAIDAAQGNFEGQTFFLKTGQDVLEGGAGNDTFIADIVQTENGIQVNTLGTGDRLDGGAGVDTLEAQVTSGANAGGLGMAIQARTTNIENIKLEAVSAYAASNSTVYVNAKNMEGVNYIGSEQSNASLTIQDLTSKGVAGGTKNMTVGMQYTGNTNSNWKESDLKVLFDQDYLTRTPDTTDNAYFWLEDRQGAADDATKPLNRINVDGVRFTVDGVQKSIIIDSTKMDDFLNGATGAGTWEGFVALLKDALAAAQAEDSSLAGLSWTLDYNNLQTVGLDGTVLPVPVPAMVLTTNVTDQKIEAIGFHQYEEATGQYDVYGSFLNGEQVVTFDPVEINVELEKVGRAGDGGELVIGSMNKGDDTNVWNSVNTVGENTVSGVEVFHVTVDGGKAESSSLSGMRSTNNNLKVVNVKSATDSNANLTIGNSNTDNAWNYEGWNSDTGSYEYYDFNTLATYANALKDVQIFNAKDFNGDLNLTAALTGEVTNKYLADGGKDGAFVYTGGNGNDTFNIALSTDNLAASGNATHGDFDFAINSGNGNDTITVGLYDQLGELATDNGNWYQNQKTNANLSINAGNGDDTVNLLGSGDWKVNLGEGNDVIYVDNSGNKSSWVFNAVGADATDYQGNGDWDVVGGGNIKYNLYKVGVTVTLTDDKGGEFELRLSVEPDTGLYQTSQKAINNAIKDAIKNDSVFSKLLEATTGQEADTLIINSLIDGQVELDIEFEQLAENAGQPAVNIFNKLYGATASVGGLASAYASGTTTNPYTTEEDKVGETFGSDVTTGQAVEILGGDGNSFGAQTIEGGKGNDVLVLGTDSNQTHTLVYKGYDNGKDTIVNFDGNTQTVSTTNPADGDVLDLTDYSAKSFIQGAYGAVGQAATTTAIKAALVAAVNGKHIVFNEKADNDGEYSVTVWEKTATGITEVNTIGVLDFGDTVNFTNQMIDLGL